MKFNSLFAIGGVLFSTFPVFAVQEPSYPLLKEVLVNLAGSSEAGRQRGPFTCKNLLEKTWPYPNADVLSLCYDAERSCYTYHLLKDYQKKEPAPDAKVIKESLQFAITDAQLKLTACMVMLEHSGLGSTHATIPSYGSSVVIPSVPLVPAQK